MTDSLLAAPPPSEPATNYVELIGIPLLVAVVTSLVTAYVATRRSRNERLATMRLEMYRDLVVRSKRWANGLRAANMAEVEGRDWRPYQEIWQEDADQFMDQVALLPIISRKRAHSRIRGALDDVAAAAHAIDTEAEMEERSVGMREAIERMETLTEVIIEEGRREIRRTGV